ncbi:hypothetical protein [Pedobacter psychroterrae]|uniref:hypothetical protein n=1 Tax=Pedobacter psychroterrae TaxID=2530453 RepID=UPI0013F15B68|nr:hypothetical protein [Pedobacter psychroterrae]
MKILSYLAAGTFLTLPALAQNTDQPKKLNEVIINSISRQGHQTGGHFLLLYR